MVLRVVEWQPPSENTGGQVSIIYNLNCFCMWEEEQEDGERERESESQRFWRRVYEVQDRCIFSLSSLTEPPLA